MAFLPAPRSAGGIFAVAMLFAAFLPRGALATGCSLPLTDGPTPKASDCLQILRAAVGQVDCDPECICDPSGDGNVRSSDALLCLRKAVGQDVELLCPCPVTTTTTTTTLPYCCGLLENGDFELPVQASPQNGWSFVNIGSGGWSPGGGNPGGEFTLNQAGQYETDPTLSQTVSGLTVGATYLLRGEYRSFAANYGDPSKPDAFAVLVEPAPQGQFSTLVLGLPHPSPVPTDWTSFEVEFVASDATHTLLFQAERDGDDSSFDVDNLGLWSK